MGPIKSKIGEKRTKIGPFGVLSLMKIPLVSPSLDQKEQNCFGHPKFYSSIAPMNLSYFKKLRISNLPVRSFLHFIRELLISRQSILHWDMGDHQLMLTM